MRCTTFKKEENIISDKYRQTPNTIQKKLLKLGFSIQKKEIFTPLIALQNFLQKNKDKKILLVVSKEIEKELKNLR